MMCRLLGTALRLVVDSETGAGGTDRGPRSVLHEVTDRIAVPTYTRSGPGVRFDQL